MIGKKLASATFLGLLLGFVVTLLLAVSGHCSVTKKNTPNGLGVTLEDSNPWGYMFGTPSSVNVFEDKDRMFTNVRFIPFGAALLHHENIWFCGNQEALFGDSGLRIVVYRRTAEHVYQGTACHEVLKVVDVDLKEGQ